MEDIALWNLMLKGNMKPLEALYRRHYELLLNFGLKYTLDEEFVRDCIQDLFVKICSSSSLSATDYVRSYLLTSLKLTEDINELSFELKVEDASLEVLFKDNDEDLRVGKKMLEAYKSLPDNQRVAIYLRYIKGLSYKEVAAVLDINPQSSMNLVSRALTNLRSKMTLEEYFLLISLFLSYNSGYLFIFRVNSLIIHSSFGFRNYSV